jgi:succinate dehydrogenase/fumarate reductase-like Fe-S protein
MFPGISASKEDQKIQAAQARRPGRHLADAAGRCDRVQEFRKCIECFLCQDVCHVLRDHHKHDEFIGPRFLVYTAALEMHPLDTEDRCRN